MKIELSRYLGVWFQIARIPSFFDKHLVGAIAIYTKGNSEEVIYVQNIGIRPDGTLETISGIAHTSPRNGELYVSFSGSPPGQYLIEFVNNSYDVAIVGNDARSNLWILSRSPQMRLQDARRLINLVRHNYNDQLHLLIPSAGALIDE